MRQIAIVGAGQAGLQLGFELLHFGYQVTLVSDRTSEEILNGKIMSSQGMFHAALQNERELGLNFWEKDCPQNSSVTFAVADPQTHQKSLYWKGYVEHIFQAIDQRLKFSYWLIEFEKQGGKLIIRNADIPFLEQLTKENELVVIASGKGKIGELFKRDNEKSAFDKPMRSLACHYVNDMTPIQTNPGVRVNMVPGIGEYFTMPGLTINGPCEMMLFEGIPGGPFDCWNHIKSPEEQLNISLELLKKYIPWEAERCQYVVLTDQNATLKGGYVPIVRKPIAKLPSGNIVFGIGDTVILNDPIAGQGANNASKCARIYAKYILNNNKKPFDEIWMQNTFDDYWQHAQWATAWSNALLMPPPPHVFELLIAAANNQEIANEIANGFNDPSSLFPWIMCPNETKEVIVKLSSKKSSKISSNQTIEALAV